MNHTNQLTPSKAKYEEPKLEIRLISYVDIITTSGDENQGEWDPQSIDDFSI